MKEKRKTLDKKEENLKFKKISKKQKWQERGITLIALVITIIILLILTGVTLNIALSDNGLFSKTKKAAEDYKEAQNEEEESIRQISTQLYSEYVGAIVEGYSPASSKDTVKIEKTTSGLDSKTDNEGNTIEGVGEDFSQTFTAEDMNWRVWDFDGNILRIIGEPTTSKLTLKGAAGYNNGVWAMDYICKTLYSDEEKGAIATNLKRTDIQKVSTYDYTQYKHQPNDYFEDTTKGDESSIYFGATKTYSGDNVQYPDMWNDNDKDWTYKYKDGNRTGGDKECEKWEVIGNSNGQMSNKMNTGDEKTEFKQSYYYHDYNKNEFIKSAYYDLIFKNKDDSDVETYWLGGRYVHLYENSYDFGVQFVSISDGKYRVHGFPCVKIGTDGQSSNRALRPIVSINLMSSKYTMTSETNADGKMTITLS